MPRVSLVASAASTVVAITGAASGDAIMTWAMTICNIAILIANTVIAIYRKFRDRDDDKKDNKRKEENKDEKDVE